MATSKIKRPRRVVVMATSEILLKQISTLWVELPAGTDVRDELRVIMGEVESLVKKIKATLEPMGGIDDYNEVS
jgi:hypothetical protein